MVQNISTLTRTRSSLQRGAVVRTPCVIFSPKRKDLSNIFTIIHCLMYGEVTSRNHQKKKTKRNDARPDTGIEMNEGIRRRAEKEFLAFF